MFHSLHTKENSFKILLPWTAKCTKWSDLPYGLDAWQRYTPESLLSALSITNSLLNPSALLVSDMLILKWTQQECTMYFYFIIKNYLKYLTDWINWCWHFENPSPISHQSYWQIFKCEYVLRLATNIANIFSINYSLNVSKKRHILVG